MHTPDYFVIRQDSAGWVECKSSEDLQKLAIRTPNRYLRDGSGKSRCPPGEAHSSPLGLDYRVWSSAENSTGISSEISRSWKTTYDVILQAWLGLSTRPSWLRSSKARNLPERTVGQVPAEFRTLNQIYLLIATGGAYVDLSAAAIVEPEQVRVFANSETAGADQCACRDEGEGATVSGR